MLARNIPLYALLAFSLLICSCADDEGDSSLTGPVGPEPGGSNTETIGLLGGEVSYGAAMVIIPPGALSAPEDITIEIPLLEPDYVEPADVVQIGYMYEGIPFEIEFGLPVSVVFTYDEDDVGIYDESTLVLWTFAEAGDTLIALEDIFPDTANNVVIGVAAQLAYFVMTASTEGVVTTVPPVPELIAPYDGMSDNRLSVTFRWESTTGALFYHLQIAFDEEFTLLYYDEPGVSGALHGISGFDQNTEYYWRLRAGNTFGTGPWSEERSFTTGDGSCNTLEGTWEYDHGEFGYPSSESVDCIINSWGNLVLSIGGGTFDVEGMLWFHEVLYSLVLGEIIAEETYSIAISEEGTYSIEENTMPIFPYDQVLRMEVTDSNDPNRIGAIEEKIFEVSGDSLTLFFYGLPLDNWGNGISNYRRL